MSEIEYHGWIVLASSRDDWADDEFRRAFSEIDQYIKDFGLEGGHSMGVAEAAGYMHTLFFHGLTLDAPERLYQLMEFVSGVFDAAYGELVLAQGRRFDWTTARRYRLSEGRVAASGS
jgi:hypothetical protein